MENTYSSTNKKNSSGKNQFGTYKDMMKNPEELPKALSSGLIDGSVRSELIELGLEQAQKAGRFLKANWKTVVPVIAVLGVGAIAATAILGKKALED